MATRTRYSVCWSAPAFMLVITKLDFVQKLDKL